MKKILRQAVIIIAVITALAVITPVAAGAADVGGRTISSGAAVVIDFDTGVTLFEHNAHSQRVPASMIKIVAVHVVYDAIREGLTSLDSTVRITQNASTLSGDTRYSNIPLPVGSYFSVRDLIDVVIVRSACAATVALGEGVFGSEGAMVSRMRQKAADLGVEATFVDCWGASASNRITAHGMAIMARALIMDHPEVLQVASRLTSSYNGRPNSNQILPGYHGTGTGYPGLDGLKTGYTIPAGYCFIGTAQQSGRRIIAVTMNSTLESRFRDTEALLDYGFENAEAVIAELGIDPGGPDDPVHPVHPVYDFPMFLDVPADTHWAYEIILETYFRGLMTGMQIMANGDIVFDPSGTLTRAQVAQILYNAYSDDLASVYAPAITDVADGAWFAAPIAWLVGTRIAGLDYTEEGSYFYPHAPATRAFMAEQLFNLAEALGVTMPETHAFIDFPDVNDDYSEAVAALQQAGVIEGYPDGTYKPDDALRRQEAAALMLRFTDIGGLATPAMRQAAALATPPETEEEANLETEQEDELETGQDAGGEAGPEPDGIGEASGEQEAEEGTAGESEDMYEQAA